MSAPYPWLAAAWQSLQQRRQRGELAHGLLFKGREGFGQLSLAEAFAASVLCRSATEDGESCRTCQSCLLLQAGSHPDYRLVQPEETGKAIVIDQIRALGEYFTLRPHYGTSKVAIIHPADAMNRSAANSLLKLLEEPPPGGLLLLVSSRPERLPATVRSRCQSLALDRIDPAMVLQGASLGQGVTAEDLARAGGSPLAALRFGEPVLRQAVDALPEWLEGVAANTLPPLEAAARSRPFDLITLIDQCLRLCHEIALIRCGAPLPLAHAGRTPAPSLQRLANQIDSLALAEFVQKALDLKQLRLNASSARETDLVESLWFDWQRVRRAPTDNRR